jgi:archaellum component FlaC
MNENELKTWIETGFRGVAEGFRGVDRQFKETNERMDARFLKLEDEIKQVGMKYEDIIDLLKYVKDGESPQLVRRVSALEVRVNTLEKKKR